ncbi:MAG TPA: YbaK/EbsC family protein [Thermoanaerobaculia bacterium]|nr:YbaK/EbsC family protein [Thermoanaerobaculia bacterium]
MTEVPADAAWERVRDALGELQIPFEAMPCDPDFADTAAFCEKYGIPAGESANTILVASRQEPRRWAACLVLSNCRLDVNHAVSRLLGVKRLSFASADETREKTGMMIGGVSLVGLPPDVPVFVDARVLEAPRVVVGGGSRSWKVRLDPKDLSRIPGARVIEGLATVKS